MIDPEETAPDAPDAPDSAAGTAAGESAEASLYEGAAPMGGTAESPPAVGGGVGGGGVGATPSAPPLPPPPADNPPPPPESDKPPPPPSPRAGAGDPWISQPGVAASPAKDDGESVEVIDPQEHGEGRSRYTSYCVVLRCGQEQRSAVRRRYSDFRWLFGRLHKERPGTIVPIMPHKAAVRSEVRLSEETVSYRRKHCELWLRRLRDHPELRDSPSLVAFLKSDDDMFASAKRSDDIDMPTEHDDDEDKPMVWGGSSTASAGGKKSFPRIRKLATKVKVAMRSGSDLEKAGDEEKFEAIETYITDLDVQIQWLSKHATGLVKTYQDQSKTLETIGSKFTDMGGLSYPNTHSSNSSRLSALLNKIGDGVSALGLTELKRFDELTVKFDEPVQELVRDVQSVKDALQRRREIQVNYTDKINKTVRKTSELDNVRANPRPNLEQQKQREEDAEKALEDAKKDAVVWHDEFDAVSRRLLRETERFRDMFRDKVRRTCAGWANVQMEYYTKSNDGWGDVLPFLDAEDLVGPDAGGGGYSLSSTDQNGPPSSPKLEQI